MGQKGLKHEKGEQKARKDINKKKKMDDESEQCAHKHGGDRRCYSVLHHNSLCWPLAFSNSSDTSVHLPSVLFILNSTPWNKQHFYLLSLLMSFVPPAYIILTVKNIYIFVKYSSNINIRNTVVNEEEIQTLQSCMSTLNGQSLSNYFRFEVTFLS